MHSNLEEAIRVFNQGGIVIFPTDTAYGIGCRVDVEETIKKLFILRKREETKPMSLLIDSISMAASYVSNIPEEVEKELLKKYWPGGLTVILEADKRRVPSLVRAHGDTIGLRIPDHKDLLYVISKVGVPILGPSANFSGEKTPFSFNEVDKRLISLVDFVLEGECYGQEASTVIDCTKKPYEIVRQGAVIV